MPTYEYQCTQCSERLEVVQSFSDTALAECPKCAEPTLRKLFGNVGVVFKGSGFYRNDSREESRKKSESSKSTESSKSATKDSKSSSGTAKSDSSSSSGTKSGTGTQGSNTNGSGGAKKSTPGSKN